MNFKPALLSLVISTALLAGCNTKTDALKTQANADHSDITQGKAALIPFADEIPHPSQMQVDITSSGRITTLNSIDVVKVGKNIPYT